MEPPSLSKKRTHISTLARRTPLHPLIRDNTPTVQGSIWSQRTGPLGAGWVPCCRSGEHSRVTTYTPSHTPSHTHSIMITQYTQPSHTHDQTHTITPSHKHTLSRTHIIIITQNHTTITHNITNTHYHTHTHTSSSSHHHTQAHALAQVPTGHVRPASASQVPRCYRGNRAACDSF